jgi:hypothetical protein
LEASDGLVLGMDVWMHRSQSHNTEGRTYSTAVEVNHIVLRMFHILYNVPPWTPNIRSHRSAHFLHGHGSFLNAHCCAS